MIGWNGYEWLDRLSSRGPTKANIIWNIKITSLKGLRAVLMSDLWK